MAVPPDDVPPPNSLEFLRLSPSQSGLFDKLAPDPPPGETPQDAFARVATALQDASLDRLIVARTGAVIISFAHGRATLGSPEGVDALRLRPGSVAKLDVMDGTVARVLADPAYIQAIFAPSGVGPWKLPPEDAGHSALRT